MLLFKTFIVGILLLYLSLCTGLFIYRKLPQVWHNIGMVIFFVGSCHYFGVKTLSIVLLYLSACALNFMVWVLSAVSISKTRDGAGYKTIYRVLLDGNRFSYNKYKGHLALLPQSAEQHPQLNAILKINQLFLRAFLPLWLSCFSIVENFNNSFNNHGSFHFFKGRIKNKIVQFFKNIKAR